jgi:gliding motility-associated-like protein
MRKITSFQSLIISFCIVLYILLPNLASAQSIGHANGTYCVGVTNIFYYGGPGSVVSWSTNGTVVSGGGTNSWVGVVWNNPTTNGYVQVSNTSQFGSNSIYLSPIAISTSAAPSVSISVNNNNVCPGTAVTFTASAVNGGTSPNYSWYVNGNFVASGTSNTYSTSSLTNGQQVSCTMTSSAACASTSTANSNVITMSINSPQQMGLTISGNTSVCQGGTVSFSASITNQTSSVSYQWKKNGVNVSSDANVPPYVLVLNSVVNNDVISCMATPTGGCSTPVTSNSLTISITQPQTFTVSVSPSIVIMSPGSTVTFSANSNLPAQNYQWSMNGSPVAGANSPTFTTIANSGAQLRTVSVSAVTSTYCVVNTAATGSAQNIPFVVSSISGNTTVAAGATETYTVNWDWDFNYENNATVTWNVTNGTVLSSDKHTATIKWNTPPFYSDDYGSVSVSESYGRQSAWTSVSIANRTASANEACSGILGPPAVFVDFGRGNNPGPALPNTVTNYKYNSICGLVSGEYTITNTTFNCRSFWLGTLNHTPNDPNGYMMMVDGDDKRGEFYRTTVTGLTTAFRYEFSAWVGSISDDQQEPKIRFEVYDNSGNLLGASGDISVPYKSPFQWQRVAFMFDLPSNITSVQVVIVNRHNSTQGNDMVIDDISFAPCYTPIIASFSPNPTVRHKEYICSNGGTVNLYSWWPTPSIPFANPLFQWQKSTDGGATWADISGATSINYTQTETVPNIYKYRIKSFNAGNPSQFILSNVLTYYVQRMVVEAKTFNVYACNDASRQLNAVAYLQYSDPQGPPLTFNYSWSPSTYLSNSQIQDPIVTLPPQTPSTVNGGASPPPIMYNYMLTVQNTNFNCSAAAQQTVAQYTPRKVWVPNAFTPDGDGLNDVFRPINIWDYPGAKFWVFNRWGQVVFFSQGPGEASYNWDGKINGLEQKTDVFVWRVEIPGCPNNIFNTTSMDDKAFGQVTLIR